MYRKVAFAVLTASLAATAGAQTLIDPAMMTAGENAPFNGAQIGGSIGWSQTVSRAVYAAAVDDVRPGRRVLDSNGYFLGEVTEVAAGNAIVRERGRTAAIPLSAFQRDHMDLRLPITVNEFRATAERTRS